jgi:hypothetical protein
MAAIAYGATPDQACVFSIVNVLMISMLRRLMGPYLKNTRQYALAEIATQATSGLAGVLMTRLFCKKMIHWQQALASSVISDAAVVHVSPLSMKPMPLAPLLEMMNG